MSGATVTPVGGQLGGGGFPDSRGLMSGGVTPVGGDGGAFPDRAEEAWGQPGLTEVGSFFSDVSYRVCIGQLQVPGAIMSAGVIISYRGYNPSSNAGIRLALRPRIARRIYDVSTLFSLHDSCRSRARPQ